VTPAENDAPSGAAPPPDARPAELEIRIPKLLRAGLLTSSLLMVAGLAWYAARPPSGGPPFSLLNLGALLSAPDPRAIIGIGILVLLLTPLARVIASLLHFLEEKDRLYAGLTAVVIFNLAAAVALGTV
jgi:uncharacterized membrane protein